MPQSILYKQRRSDPDLRIVAIPSVFVHSRAINSHQSTYTPNSLLHVSKYVISTNTRILRIPAEGCSRFNVRCLIRCIYLPLQPGSGHSPFTPGGIHKSNKKDRSGRREEKDTLVVTLVSLRAPRRTPMSFAHLLLFPDR